MREKRLKELSKSELLEIVEAQALELERRGASSPCEQLERRARDQLKRDRYKRRYARVLRSVVGSLAAVAAAAVLVATLWLPVLQIYGSSMTPTLEEGDVVVALKGSSFEEGDLVAFWLGNKLLVKRVIAGPGDWVDIDADGTVRVNGDVLDEPYVMDKALGDCTVKLPYQVPDGRWFVMGDHRLTSSDSRSNAVGCVAQEQIVGKIQLRVWPLSAAGAVG